MLKWLGAILIIISGMGIGFSKSYELQQHIKELEELKKIFCLIRSELQYIRMPFAELFEKISKKTTGIHKKWLEQMSRILRDKRTSSFYDVWCIVLDEEWKESHLNREEKAELRNVGRNLEYIENIDLYIEQMEYHIKQTKEDYRSKQKMYQSIGIAGGIFLVILLL